jgi:hypothetical protein
MSDLARTALKWTAAVVGLVLIVSFALPRAVSNLQQAITLDTGDDPDELPAVAPEATEPPSIESGVMVSVADLADRNGTIQQVESETIALGTEAGSQMLVAFPPVPADTACLTEVILEALLIEATPTDILVRPAQLRDVNALTAGGALPGDAIIGGTEPAAAVTDGSTGWLQWDVTGQYTLAAREAAGDLVILSIVLPEAEDEEREIVLGSVVGGEDSAARLSWSAVEGCTGVGGVPPPGAPEDPVDPAEPEEPEEA